MMTFHLISFARSLTNDGNAPLQKAVWTKLSTSKLDRKHGLDRLAAVRVKGMGWMASCAASGDTGLTATHAQALSMVSCAALAR